MKKNEPGPDHRPLFDDWPERYDRWFETPTAVHFLKSEDPARAREIEKEGSRKGSETGAFLAVRWIKI